MDGDKTDLRTWVVLGKLALGNGATRKSKELLLQYFANSPLIQLTRLGTLRDWIKLEGFSGVMSEKTS